MSSAVLVLGVASEPPVAALRQALERQKLTHLVVDQRDLAHGDWRTSAIDGSVDGELTVRGESIPLSAFGGVYTRLAAWSTVLQSEGSEPSMASVYSMHRRIEAWLETATITIANRSSANDTNNSKPLQAMLIRDYFHVPATLVTNDPESLASFRETYPSLIYKSCSGERSIVTEFSDKDNDRLQLLATVPVQFQEKLDGTDVRVHVVGRSTFATAITSDATDYRYDNSGACSYRAVEIPSEIAQACVTLTARLGLEISGIDLRLCSDGRVACFEVNPSPAYSVYQDATGQPIADCLARHLAGVS